MNEYKSSDTSYDGPMVHTVHHPDGSKELKVTTVKDVYVFLKDRMDLELFQLEQRFLKRLRLYEGLAILALTLAVIIPMVSAILKVEPWK